MYSSVETRNQRPLNESPSEKEGKSVLEDGKVILSESLNESPSEKEGKCQLLAALCHFLLETLNESPSEKEGKY